MKKEKEQLQNNYRNLSRNMILQIGNFLRIFARVSELLDDKPGPSRVKSADKMVIMPTLYDGDHPEIAKQHYE